MNSAKRLLYRALEQWTAKRKAKIIVLSVAEADSGRDLGIPEDKLPIIPTGIDAQKDLFSRHDARAMLRELLGADIPMDAFWITCIANHYPTKGLDTLLRALISAGNTIHSAHTILIGDGPERKALEKIRNDLGLAGRVHFTGFLNDAPRYLPAFDLFVLPSRKEGLPYTLLEAKLHGIPIIATDVGGISSIIENKKTARWCRKTMCLRLRKR
jgi:glycosyltransferase involved in cell wall biosynthesis